MQSLVEDLASDFTSPGISLPSNGISQFKEWRLKREISGGGELVDQRSHLIDLTQYLAGDVTTAFLEVQSSFWNMEVEDNPLIALRPLGGLGFMLHG